MAQKHLTLKEIDKQIDSNKAELEAAEKARLEAKRYLASPSSRYEAQIGLEAAAGAARRFRLMAQGDSWFDYFPGTDIIDCLHEYHGHSFTGAAGAVTNLAVGGSTLNDVAYGLVPTGLLGIPRSNDVSRIAELVRRIRLDKPQGLLLSGGGNDVAGDEFFSFINNKASGLPPANKKVVDGVLSQTFKTAYEYLIDNSLAAAGNTGMKIFLHGYDYPWPDGRGVINFPGWKVGPWFDEPFNKKNFHYKTGEDLQVRHDIVKQFMDPFNDMLKELAAQRKYSGRVHYVNLCETLQSSYEWANELHPNNDGFRKLAAKFDQALQRHL